MVSQTKLMAQSLLAGHCLSDTWAQRKIITLDGIIKLGSKAGSSKLGTKSQSFLALKGKDTLNHG